MTLPCVDCMKVAICCHLKTGDMITKCDDIRSFVIENQKLEVEHDQYPEPGPPDHFRIPKYIIKLNQENVDILHCYLRKVRACI